MKYEITGHIEGDDKEIAELFSEAFGGRQFDINAWRRNNESNPVKPYCVASMWDGDKLIAHTELSVAKAILDGKATISGVSGTTMARHGYPGASVAAYRWIDQEHPEVCKIGFPNDQSFPLIKRVLKHNYIGDIDFWWKIVGDPDDTDERIFQGCHIEETEKPSIPSDGLPICDGCRYSLVKNREFIQWRFLNRTEKGYHYFECKKQDEIVGYVVLSKYFDGESNAWHGQIVDFAAVDDLVFMALIRFAEKQFNNDNLQVVKLWCTSPSFQEDLKRCGFQYGLRPFHVELWHEDLALHEMNLTMADSDVF